MKLTKKQTEVMNVIVRGNGDGSFTDMDQCLERLSYEPSKQSFQFTVRFLVNKGLIVKHGIEKRRRRQRRVLSATTLGYSIMRSLNPSEESAE